MYLPLSEENRFETPSILHIGEPMQTLARANQFTGSIAWRQRSIQERRKPSQRLEFYKGQDMSTQHFNGAKF